MEKQSQTAKLSIKDWAENDRPREKLLDKGRGSLTDAELIAILLGSGNTELSAVDLSKLILNDSGNNLNILGKKTIVELTQYKGIGQAKAVSIVAALELGRRRKVQTAEEKKSINSSNDAYSLVYSELDDKPFEEFWIILLNRSNKVLGKYNISRGGISGTVADPKLIFSYALGKLASSIILAHNHPSGSVKPSLADRRLTDKLKRAAGYLDITILDHIIVGDSKYFSFADEGIL